jgi:hypothetical protein
MICTLTARRLKPGSYDAFRSAWGGDEDPPGGGRWNPIYHCRDVDDENVVVSFGFFDGSLDELRAAQEQAGRSEQVASVDEHVEQVLLDGAFEVVEKLEAS